MSDVLVVVVVVVVAAVVTYIYHALINAMSAHMIGLHINLNTILYTHVKHSPTKTIYIKYYNMGKKSLLFFDEETRSSYRSRCLYYGVCTVFF